MDATTGELLGAIPVSGWPSGMVAGPHGVWAFLDRRYERSRPLIEITEGQLYNGHELAPRI